MLHNVVTKCVNELIEFPEAKSLIDLIDYQADSVVSKTLIDKPAGTLTLLAFDKGQGLSEHTAPYDTVVYVIDGESEIRSNSKNGWIKQGFLSLRLRTE